MRNSKIVRAVLLTLAVARMGYGQGADDAVWRDKTKTAEARARDLLPRLTLEEKIGLVHGVTTFSNAGVPRLAIGAMWMSDGPQGVREEINTYGWNPAGRTDDFSTAMPADICLAATFDPALGKAFGNVIGEEAVARGKQVMLCPGMNIMRTPLNGRNAEYLGEDPFLAGKMAAGFIQGVQANGVAACAKHFALNNQEVNRDSVNVTVDERAMREIYLPAFKAAVMEGGALTVMTAYNRVNGSYCSENEFLLRQVLKGEWGFQGLVMSDWGGTHSTVAAAKNGLDLEMGTNVGKGNGGADPHEKDFFAGALKEAVEKGEVPAAALDEMVLRNLRVMAATGLLDGGPRVSTKPGLMAPEHIAVAREVAESGCVLLKNEGGVLPLDGGKVKTIAVIGDNAVAKFAHDGNSAQIKTKYEVTPLEGITKRAGDLVKVTYAQGYARAGGRGRRGGAATMPANGALIEEAVAAAKSADVAIVVAGLYRGQDQEGADRPNMNLPPGQAELIGAVVAANPRTIVVLNGGSPSVVTPWIDRAAGLVMYWYGGTEGGTALARVLFGDVNPSGKLPCTWPKILADSPAHAAGDAQAYPGTGARGRGVLTAESGPQETYGEGIFVGYRWFDEKKIEPQFPFGFGLSYTTFEVADVKVMAANGKGSGLNKAVAEVEVTVGNTGGREGAEVVQVYVGELNASVSRPVRELKGFAKVMVKKGEKATVKVPLDLAAFAFWDTGRKAWVAEAGEFKVFVGTSSRELGAGVPFMLKETVVVKEGE